MRLRHVEDSESQTPEHRSGRSVRRRRERDVNGREDEAGATR